MRVEDLPRIQQSQITNNTLLYLSNNGIPFAGTIVDLASQVSGVTGSYVINSQLSGTSGVLTSQINSVNSKIDSFSGNSIQFNVFLTGNQIISGNKIFQNPINDTSSINSLDINNRILKDNLSQPSLDWNNKIFYNNWKVNIGSGNNNYFQISDGSNQNFLIKSDTDLDGSGVGTYSLQTSGIYGAGGRIVFISPWSGQVDGDIFFEDFNGMYFKMSAEPIHVLNGGISIENIDNTIDGGALSVNNNLIIDANGITYISGIKVADTISLQTTGQTLYKYITGSSGMSSVKNVVFATGNQTISGNKTFSAPLYSSLDSLASIDINSRSLIKNNAVSINWDTKVLNDSIENTSLEWDNRFLADSNIFTSVDWNNRLLYNNNNVVVADWNNALLSGLNGTTFDWSNGIFYGIDGNAQTINMINYQLNDNTQSLSVDWKNRELQGNWDVSNTLTVSGISIDEIGNKIIKSPKIDLKSTGSYSLYTVPDNHLFVIDSMEIITSDILSPSSAPFIEFGNTTSLNAYQASTQTTSNSQYSRHIFNNPQDAIPAGTILTVTINTQSTAIAHLGFLIFKGYLINHASI